MTKNLPQVLLISGSVDMQNQVDTIYGTGENPSGNTVTVVMKQIFTDVWVSCAI